MAKIRPQMAKMRPKMAKMRPKMAKMRPKRAKIRPKMAKMRPFLRDLCLIPYHKNLQILGVFGRRGPEIGFFF